MMPTWRAAATDPRLFLSYSHRDREIVRRMARDLTEQGVHIWLDEATLFLGDHLTDRISAAIANVDHVAVVLSRQSVRSTWVRTEVEITIADEQRGDGRPKLLLIRIDDCQVPDYLAGREIIDLTEAAYQASIDRLLGRLRSAGDSGAAASRPATHWPSPEEAFTPVRWLRLHIAFYDGTEFGAGRLLLSADTRIDELPLPATAQFYQLDLDERALESARLAHVESRSWLRRGRTFADEGIRSGEHIIVTTGAAADAEIVVVVDAFAIAQASRGDDP